MLSGTVSTVQEVYMFRIKYNIVDPRDRYPKLGSNRGSYSTMKTVGDREDRGWKSYSTAALPS